MLTKSIASLILLLLSFATQVFSVPSLDCEIVAEIFTVKEMFSEISILRKGAQKPTWAAQENRKLCSGDRVTVPNRRLSSKIAIYYYAEKPHQIMLKQGQHYQVESLSSPCGTWCTVQHDLERLVQKLTSPIREYVSLGTGGGREGEDNEPLPIDEITMPLDAGLGEPFYLFAQAGTIPLFWEHGQPPYQLEVNHEITGKVIIVQKDLNTNTGSLILPNTNPEQVYSLKISSAKSKPYQQKLVFAVPPFPLNPNDKWTTFTKLLMNENFQKGSKNWRLEIWRQLALMPESPEKDHFKTRLKRDLIDFEVN
jgi:hypothetical protein